jgi:hypothetical protein
MIIVLGYFDTKVGREEIFKQTVGNEGLDEISDDNGVRVVNFAHSRILFSKARCSHIITFINSLGRLLMERRITRLTTF